MFAMSRNMVLFKKCLEGKDRHVLALLSGMLNSGVQWVKIVICKVCRPIRYRWQVFSR